LYYSWLKDFMEAGKSRLKGDTTRAANESEVKDLNNENSRLKQLAGE
jgi:transposase